MAGSGSVHTLDRSRDAGGYCERTIVFDLSIHSDGWLKCLMRWNLLVINEIFISQPQTCIKNLEFTKANVGKIAPGHPLGTSSVHIRDVLFSQDE